MPLSGSEALSSFSPRRLVPGTGSGLCVLGRVLPSGLVPHLQRKSVSVSASVCVHACACMEPLSAVPGPTLIIKNRNVTLVGDMPADLSHRTLRLHTRGSPSKRGGRVPPSSAPHFHTQPITPFQQLGVQHQHTMLLRFKLTRPRATQPCGSWSEMLRFPFRSLLWSWSENSRRGLTHSAKAWVPVSPLKSDSDTLP